MRRSLLLFASLLLPSLAAHAGTITAGVYNLQNSFVGGYSVTGTVTINGAGSATAANLTFNDPNLSNSGLPNFSQISSTGVYNGLSQNYVTSTSNSGQIALYLNTTADANGFFDLCLGGTQCGTSSGTVAPATLQVYSFYNNSTRTGNSGMNTTNFSSGYLTPATTVPTTAVASTPEPASILMLGTGLVGLVAVGGRRLFPNGLGGRRTEGK